MSLIMSFNDRKKLFLEDLAKVFSEISHEMMVKENFTFVMYEKILTPLENYFVDFEELSNLISWFGVSNSKAYLIPGNKAYIQTAQIILFKVKQSLQIKINRDKPLFLR